MKRLILVLLCVLMHPYGQLAGAPGVGAIWI